MSNLLKAIAARDAQISDVRTEVIATLVEAPARFSALELVVSADCEDRDLLRKLVEIADRGCIMMNTLRDKFDLRVRVA
jgi:putative redox protein